MHLLVSQQYKHVKSTYLISIHDDIVSLTTMNVQSLGLIWHNRGHVSADDSHLVVIEVDSEGSLDRAVTWLAMNA